MNNNEASTAKGCLSILVVLILFKWLIPESIEIALWLLFIVFVIVSFIYAWYMECYKDIVKIKLNYVDRYYKDIDDSVKSQNEYIKDSVIEKASIDERIAYLDCICKQVTNIQKEDN